MDFEVKSLGEDISRSLLIFFISIAVITLISSIPSFYIFSPNIAIGFLDTILTVFLYSMLIFVYFHIAKYEREQTQLQEEVAKIQERQTDIMGQQRDIIVQNNQPNLRLRGADFEGSEVSCELENTGDGLAIYPGLYLDFDYADDSLDIPVSRVALEREPDENHRTGQMLKPTESGRFSGEVTFQTRDVEGIGNKATLEELQSHLIESDIDDVSVDIGLLYEPVNGEVIGDRQFVRRFIDDGKPGEFF